MWLIASMLVSFILSATAMMPIISFSLIKNRGVLPSSESLLDKFNNSWKNIEGEEVILVNNNKGTWYNDGVTGSIFVKEEYFQKMIKKYTLKYFGFTQKYLHPTGRSDKSALELEFFLDGTSKYYRHYKTYKRIKS